MESSDDETHSDAFAPDNAYEQFCWEWEMSGRKKKTIYVLVYGIMILSFMCLILSGVARFNKKEVAGTMLFVSNLLLLVPATNILCYCIIIKKWLIVP